MGNEGQQSFWKKKMILWVKYRKAILAFVWETLMVPVPLLEVSAVSLWQIVLFKGWSSSCSIS